MLSEQGTAIRRNVIYIFEKLIKCRTFSVLLALKPSISYVGSFKAVFRAVKDKGEYNLYIKRGYLVVLYLDIGLIPYKVLEQDLLPERLLLNEPSYLF